MDEAASRLRIWKSQGKPEELDALDRQICSCKIEGRSAQVGG